MDKIKSQLFNVVLTTLVSIILFVIKDMHGDIKALMSQMPGIQKDIEWLKDRRLRDKFDQYDAPMFRHEEQITYDSLRRK